MYGTGIEHAPSFITNVTGANSVPDAATGISVTTYGAVGDGTSDDTSAFRSAIAAARAANKPLIIPATASFYSLSGPLTITTSVIGVGYPLLRMSGGSGDGSHQIFELTDVSNIVITGVRLDGQFDTVNRPDEYDHAIALRSASNITITDCLIENPKGDAIYLGTSGNGPSTNVLIDDVTVRNPYRCIVALISSKTVAIMNSDLSKLDDYVAPIDFEPNSDPDGDSSVELGFNHFSLPNNKHGNNQWGTDSYAGDAVGSWENSLVSNPGGNNFLHDNWGVFGDDFWSGTQAQNTDHWGTFTVTNNTATSP